MQLRDARAVANRPDQRPKLEVRHGSVISSMYKGLNRGAFSSMYSVEGRMYETCRVAASDQASSKLKLERTRLPVVAQKPNRWCSRRVKSHERLTHRTTRSRMPP